MHEVLLKALEQKFGLEGTALSWFSSYLRPRSFKVNVGNSYSGEKDLRYSVPQGSCAGPVLYSAYASTIETVVQQDISIYGYADDHTLRITFPAGNNTIRDKAMMTLTNCSFHIKEWMDSKQTQNEQRQNRVCHFWISASFV